MYSYSLFCTKQHVTRNNKGVEQMFGRVRTNTTGRALFAQHKGQQDGSRIEDARCLQSLRCEVGTDLATFCSGQRPVPGVGKHAVCVCGVCEQRVSVALFAALGVDVTFLLLLSRR